MPKIPVTVFENIVDFMWATLPDVATFIVSHPLFDTLVRTFVDF